MNTTRCVDQTQNEKDNGNSDKDTCAIDNGCISAPTASYMHVDNSRAPKRQCMSGGRLNPVAGSSAATIATTTTGNWGWANPVKKGASKTSTNDIGGLDDWEQYESQFAKSR
jgi:hypothetical protein